MSKIISSVFDVLIILHIYSLYKLNISDCTSTCVLLVLPHVFCLMTKRTLTIWCYSSLYYLEHTAVFSRKSFILNFRYLFDVMVKPCVPEKLAESDIWIICELFLVHYVTEKTQNYPKTFFFPFYSLCWLLSLLLFVQTFEIQACTEDKISSSPCFFCISTLFASGRLWYYMYFCLQVG